MQYNCHFVTAGTLSIVGGALKKSAKSSKISSKEEDNGATLRENSRATGILAEMRSTFGVNGCHLLCINSSPDGTEEHQENPWAYVRKIMLRVTSSSGASLMWIK